MMYLIALVETFIYYWFDKYQFARHYKTPPRYDIEISDHSRDMMVYGLLLHMPIAFLMFSYTRIFSDDDFTSLADSLTRNQSSIIYSLFNTNERVDQPHA